MATWDEIDLDNKTWIIPPERMVVEVEHRSLSDEATIGERSKGLIRGWCSRRLQSAPNGTGKPLSVNAFRPLFRMKREGTTAHGFRRRSGLVRRERPRRSRDRRGRAGAQGAA